MALSGLSFTVSSGDLARWANLVHLIEEMGSQHTHILPRNTYTQHVSEKVPRVGGVFHSSRRGVLLLFSLLSRV